MAEQSDEKTYSDTAAFLAMRESMYWAFHRVFGGHPSADMLEELSSDDFLSIIDWCSNNDSDAFALFKEQILAYASAGQEGIDDLEHNYMVLFIGPGAPKAPAWEANYVAVEGLLLQESTLKVRYSYTELGYLPKEYQKVSDDHIAIMMDFMSKVAAEAREALDADDVTQLNTLLEVQHRFINDHLLNWVPDWMNDLKQEDTSGFYIACAECALAFFKEDETALAELLADAEPVSSELLEDACDDAGETEGEE